MLRALAVADDPDHWRRAGFAVDGDGGRCRLGDVDLVIDSGTDGRGVTGWQVDGLASGSTVDGLRSFHLEPAVRSGRKTASSIAHSQGVAAHPNGAVGLDHVVVATPDLDRTVAALGEAGLEPRRERLGEAGDRPMRQVFFRLGRPILEVVGPPERAGDGPATFWGLAVTVADLDAAAELLGDDLGAARNAVQPGRRIATVRRTVGLGTAVALMSSPQ